MSRRHGTRGSNGMLKLDMIEDMVSREAVSLDTIEWLIKAHIDEVESEWFRSFELDGAFAGQ